MKKIFFALMILSACSSQARKETFIKQVINKRHGSDSVKVKWHSVRKEWTDDEVVTCVYKVTLDSASIELNVQDTLLYTVTGDGIYLDQ